MLIFDSIAIDIISKHL